MNRILFVCTGNTCRSPMAEGLMRKILADEGLAGIEVRSAGVAAQDGTPISEHAAFVLKSNGCIGPQRSAALSQSTVEWADLILTMTSAHKRYTIQRFPETVDKIHTLKEYVEADSAAAAKIAEVERLMTDIQLKQALAKPVTDEERSRIVTLQRELPNPDIADPFGGSLQQYESCAAEIHACLIKLAAKLKDAR
ncbi:low molecular weight protein arginine phosphatase [Paenibacillus ehimensis]|uniref:low molecular weight protein arginine phosphatase n=1 Tax=Paenibacillus ehimensis TaxID=79264 RepID=UPI000FD7BE2D|nr:low molecular weight protein arginine phosphatase [Paenibacillus ehimensis]